MSTPAYIEQVSTRVLYDEGKYPVTIEDWRFDEHTQSSNIKRFTLVGRFRRDSTKYAGTQVYVPIHLGTKADPEGLDPKTQQVTCKRLKEILEATDKVPPVDGQRRSWEDLMVRTKGCDVQLSVTQKIDDGRRKQPDGTYTIDHQYAGTPQNNFFFKKLKPGPSYNSTQAALGNTRPVETRVDPETGDAHLDEGVELTEDE